MRDIVLPPSSSDKIKSNGQKELVADGVRRKPPISVHQVLSDAIPPPPTAAPPPLADSPASSVSPERPIRGRSGIINDDVDDAGCGSNTRPNSIVSSMEGGMVAIDDDIDDDITTTGSDSYGHDDDSSTNNEGKRL